MSRVKNNTNSGYIFLGWMEDGTTLREAGYIVKSGNHTYTAKWTSKGTLKPITPGQQIEYQ